MITRDVTVIIDGPSSSSTARYSKVANFQFQLRLSQQDSNQFARWAHQKWAANRGSTGMNYSASRSAAECLFMCRFSDAGMTRLSTRCGGRRPKSAKARNRGKWGTGGAAGAYGDLAAVR